MAENHFSLSPLGPRAFGSKIDIKTPRRRLPMLSRAESQQCAGQLIHLERHGFEICARACW